MCYEGTRPSCVWCCLCVSLNTVLPVWVLCSFARVLLDVGCVPSGVSSCAALYSPHPHYMSLLPAVPCVDRYSAFSIEVRTRSGMMWTVEHRYRQFLSLNKVRGACFVFGICISVSSDSRHGKHAQDVHKERELRSLSLSTAYSVRRRVYPALEVHYHVSCWYSSTVGATCLK